MLSIDQGDPQAAIGQMQATQKVLETDLAKTNEAAQAQFKAGITLSADHVNKVIVTTILVAVVVIMSLAIISFFVVRAIWQQLGGEPEYARDIARAVADGDLTMAITTGADDTSSLLAALKEMQSKLEGIVSNIKTSSATIDRKSVV